MPTLQFQCPQCAGLFQTDSSFAGQTVGCPMCGLGVTLPPLEMLGATGVPPVPGFGATGVPPVPSGMPPGPPQYGQPPMGPPPGPAQPLSLACPICGGGFMIPPELAGQQVGCPHCHQPVSVPGPALGATGLGAAGVPPVPSRVNVPQPAPPAPVQAANAPPPTFLYPPGFEPPGAKASKPAAAPPSPTPSSDRWSSKGTSNRPSEPVPGRASPEPLPGEKLYKPAAPSPPTDPRYPPGMATPSKPAAAPPSAPIDPRYPPGMAPPGKPEAPSRPIPAPKVEPAPAPAPSPVEKKPAPAPAPVPAPSRPTAKTNIDDLLPPSADVDDLLPPGAADVEVTPATPNMPIPVSAKPVDDSLLPPGMGEVATGPMQQVALPEAEMARQLRELNRPLPPANVPKDAVLIPTEEGQYVALREPVKTIGKGLEERELHVLPPEVKQKRRLLRNFIVYTIMLLILIAAFYLLLGV